MLHGSYDLIVIGTGPAGHHAAIQGAKLGKRVAIVEGERCVGGACINTGTIPSKTLREAVLYLSGYRERGIYGASYRPRAKASMEDLLNRARQVTERERDVYRLQFARNGVDVLHGVGSFADPNTVAVAGEGLFLADRIIIATGTVPARSTSFPVDGDTIIDGDGILSLRRIPETMIVVGGGVIGLEYACMFAQLGAKVTVVDGRSKVLEFVDSELVEALTYHLRDTGVTMRLGEEVDHLEPAEDGVRAVMKSNKILTAETVLFAVGRQGSTDGLMLSNAGLEADNRGRLKVNERFQTEQQHIFAAGDVIGFPSLASTSMEQGRLACLNAFGIEDVAFKDVFPYGLYTIPEISFVGQTEEQLTDAAIPYETGTAHYREIARGQILGDTTGRLKLIFDRDTRQILGVHVFGEGATELVHIGQAVMALGGTIDYFIDHVFNYPTLAECYKVAALHGRNKLLRTRRAA
jgi:NAD(P) transhydrogenase